MDNKETKLVGSVLLTDSEISEGFSYLYDEFGPIVSAWSKEKQELNLSKYWLSQGKTDMTNVNKMIEDNLRKNE